MITTKIQKQATENKPRRLLPRSDDKATAQTPSRDVTNDTIASLWGTKADNI